MTGLVKLRNLVHTTESKYQIHLLNQICRFNKFMNLEKKKNFVLVLISNTCANQAYSQSILGTSYTCRTNQQISSMCANQAYSQTALTTVYNLWYKQTGPATRCASYD